MKEIIPGSYVTFKKSEIVMLPTNTICKVIHISRKEPKIGITLNSTSPVIYITTSLVENIYNEDFELLNPTQQ